MTATNDVLDNIDHALHDWSTSPDAMRWTPERARTGLTPERVDALSRVFRTFGAAVARGIKDLARSFEQAATAYARFAHKVMEHDRARCRICRPYANPTPTRHGAAYRARTRRRTRRNR